MLEEFSGKFLLLTQGLGLKHWVLNVLRTWPSNALSAVDHKALHTLEADKSISILWADKRRMMVILNKTDYIEKTDSCCATLPPGTCLTPVQQQKTGKDQ